LKTVTSNENKIRFHNKILLKTLLFTFFAVTSLSVYSQQPNISTNDSETKRIAVEQIKHLNGSVLLVRLKTGKSTIDAMQKAGKTKMAANRQKQVDEENKRIIKAFKDEFDFCPVYFFYSDDSHLLKDKNFESIVYVNDSAQKDSNITTPSSQFSVTEFGSIGQDEGAIFDMQGLIIMNEEFVPLQKPFPFFVKKSSLRNSKKSIFIAVNKMNRNLWAFYNLGL